MNATKLINDLKNTEKTYIEIRGERGYVVVDQSLTNFSRDLPEFKMEWLNHG